MDDKFLDNNHCKENDSDHQVEDQAYIKKNILLIIDDDGMVKNIKQISDNLE